jgi:hypothetical protein
VKGFYYRENFTIFRKVFVVWKRFVTIDSETTYALQTKLIQIFLFRKMFPPKSCFSDKIVTFRDITYNIISSSAYTAYVRYVTQNYKNINIYSS